MKNVMKVICIVLLLATVGVQAELLVNPGFEDGPLGQTGLTDWVETGVNIPGWYYWGYDGLANMGWVHDLEGRVQDTQGICLAWDTTLILQEFGHGTLVEGQQYDFSVDVRDSTVNTLDDADGWNGFMTAEILCYRSGRRVGYTCYLVNCPCGFRIYVWQDLLWLEIYRSCFCWYP